MHNGDLLTNSHFDSFSSAQVHQVSWGEAFQMPKYTAQSTSSNQLLLTRRRISAERKLEGFLLRGG